MKEKVERNWSLPKREWWSSVKILREEDEGDNRSTAISQSQRANERCAMQRLATSERARNLRVLSTYRLVIIFVSTIPCPRNPITVKRTVTNVGAPESIYKATIEPPFGTIVYVNPTALAFNSTVEKLTFTITISAIHEMNTGYYFGSLTWVDGMHAVRISLSVKTELLQPHDDDED
ncbi:hypothetical protein PS1_015170 [Malus domestica]